jgi:hypothetical protein
MLGLAALAAWPGLGPAADSRELTLKASDDAIEFLVGKETVARYNKGAGVAKPYFWPLLGPNGAPITRAWPMQEAKKGESTDHPHQKSAWFCHGDVIPEGVEIKDRIKGIEGVDFWSEAKGHGRIVCTKVGELKLAKNHGSVMTTNEWRTADGATILKETRNIHLYEFGDSRLFVFDIDLLAAVPLTFGDTKEGSFGVRVNDEMVEQRGKVKGKGRIENADGKVGEKECWGHVSAWCDYSGPVQGKTVGLAILADSANPYPSCWHSRGYGLMAANPFARGKSGFPGMKGRTDLVKLAKGEHLKLRYGILIHPGDAKEGKVAEQFKRFVKLKEEQ